MKQVHILLDEDFYKKVKEHTEKKGKTLSGMVRVGLIQQLEGVK